MAASVPGGVQAAIEEARRSGECDLSDLGLTALPSEVTRIAGLRMLSLRGNRLTEFPAGLDTLAELQVLTLDRNGLTSLPARIAELSRLERLTLGSNELTELPPEIGLLRNLNTLTISRNQLTRLPAELGLLRNLELLAASGNQLTELPPEIGDLPGLQFLSLMDNHITALPTSLAGPLRAGLVLQLDGNPLDAPIRELHERDPGLLAAYLDSLADAIPQYEAKMMVVGEGNTGKTSLLAALRQEPFCAGRPTTHGIEIRDLALPRAGADGELTVHAWDFGGQEVYRVTHQLFFSANALYLVVWKPRDGQEQNEVEGWLRRIRLRVAAAGRALVVATHCSGERQPDLDFPSLKREFGVLLGASFEVDNETGYRVAELRAAIAAEVERFPQMGQGISPRWVEARNEILELAGREPQISFERFAAICANHGIPADQAASLGDLLHLAGQVVYYSDDHALRDFVVLDPEWLTRAISFVLEDAVTRKSGGILDHARLREIWRDRVAASHGQSVTPIYPTSYHPYFLRLMEKFDISYRIADDPDRSLVAQMVPYDRPALPWDSRAPVPPRVRRLAMTCRLSEPVPGLIPWLTVRHHDAATGLHWRNGVFLRHPIAAYASEALLEMSTPTQMLIDVRAPAPDYFFSVLRYSVEDLMTRRWPGLDYELLVPCPTIDGDGTPCQGTMPLRDLMVYREEGETRFLCAKCRTRLDLSALLTGFAQPLASMRTELDRLHDQFRADLEDVHTGIARLQASAADTANAIRLILAAVRTEIADCPRLFTLSRDTSPAGLRRLRVDQDHYRLVLWCEQPGHWHPWQAACYRIDQPKEWFTRIGPYALLVFRALQLVAPMASAAVGVAVPTKELSGVKAELDLMRAVIDALPDTPPGEGYPGADDLGPVGPMTPAQGAAARAARSLILSCDPWRSFGDLRRIQASSGELLWVCPEHYSHHDPGLPTVPA